MTYTKISYFQQIYSNTLTMECYFKNEETVHSA